MSKEKTVKMVAFRSHLSPKGMVTRGAEFELTEDQAKRYDAKLKHLGGRVEGGSGGGLPEGFPGREHLIAAGLDTLESLEGKSKEDLVALDGIGDATAVKILAELK